MGGDREIVREAVKRNRRALQYASEELRGDRNVVLECLGREGPCALQHASLALRGDPEFVKQVVREEKDGWALRYASDELRGNREFVLEALSIDGGGWARDFALDELRQHNEIAGDRGLRRVPKSFKEDMGNLPFPD